MTIHAFYIYDRHCNCIYSREYNHKSPSQGSINENNESDMAKLLFGIIYSLKNLSSKLGSPLPVGEGDVFEMMSSRNPVRSFSTGYYRVHLFESLSNYKFALVSDLSVENLQLQLWELYSNYFVKNVLNNALCPVEFGESKLNSASFISLTDQYIRELPVFL